MLLILLANRGEVPAREGFGKKEWDVSLYEIKRIKLVGKNQQKYITKSHYPLTKTSLPLHTQQQRLQSSFPFDFLLFLILFSFLSNQKYKTILVEIRKD